MAAAHEERIWRQRPCHFIIENNQVASARGSSSITALRLRRLARQLRRLGAVFDGNNVLDAYAATRIAAERCRTGNGPALLIAETFRMGGHATHDEREARETFPPELFNTWGKRDPIGLYEEYLKEDGVPAKVLGEVEDEVANLVEQAAAAALASREKMPEGPTALEGVYASRN